MFVRTCIYGPPPTCLYAAQLDDVAEATGEVDVRDRSAMRDERFFARRSGRDDVFYGGHENGRILVQSHFQLPEHGKLGIFRSKS